MAGVQNQALRTDDGIRFLGQKSREGDGLARRLKDFERTVSSRVEASSKRRKRQSHFGGIYMLFPFVAGIMFFIADFH